MSTERILIVDDDPMILESIAELLKLEGYSVLTASSADQALMKMGQQPCQLVLTDVNMPSTSGLQLLRKIRDTHPQTVVVLITGYGTIESAVESIKMGAYHYVTKPIIDEEIKVIVARALEQYRLLSENQELREQLGLKLSFDNIIGQDYKMKKLFELVKVVADTDTTVLITGESGTGKTLLARALHHN